MRNYKGGVNSYKNKVRRLKQHMTRVNLKGELEDIAAAAAAAEAAAAAASAAAIRKEKEQKIIAAGIYNQDYFNSDPPPPNWLLNRIIFEHRLGGKSKTRRNKTRKHRTKTK